VTLNIFGYSTSQLFDQKEGETMEQATIQMPWIIQFLSNNRGVIMPILVSLCVLAIVPIVKGISSDIKAGKHLRWRQD
jgi:hypothetical protein